MNKEMNTMPLLPLRGVALFPEVMMHFDVGREKSVKALHTAMANDRMIFAVSQKDADIDEPTGEDLYSIGTIAEIKQMTQVGEGQFRIILKGVERARIIKVTDEKHYIDVYVDKIEEEILEDSFEKQALIRTLKNLFEIYSKLNTVITDEMKFAILGIPDIFKMADVMIGHLSSVDFIKKQEVLECISLEERITKVIAIVEEEIQVLLIQKKIMEKVKSNIDEAQKEYYLKEQIKVIQEELGDKEGIKADIKNYEEKIQNASLPIEVREKLEKEVKRLKWMQTASPEYGNIRTYIDTMLDLPWGKSTEEITDIKKATRILQKDHYGLEEIKERVIDYLIVKNRKAESNPPLLCLVGPPGVGKTSIAKSISKATGRKYVRVSLGGVKDEADIRGHRRTYIGSMPGRMIHALKEAKSENPLILLDEIDKMARDFRGDPAAALLEVLDYKQNSTFKDHYLEVPVDLSKVLFIATANEWNALPKPLLDRMELIHITSYMPSEKVEIARKYLLPNQLEKHGLTKEALKISKANISYLIEHYTREAGVRGLERILAKLCRKVSRELLKEESQSVTITSRKLEEYLGKPTVRYEMRNAEAEIGIVRGLAWTSVGGDTLSIEVNCMEGKGNIELTGNMGTVMKESAKAAISYIRSRVEELAIDSAFYKNKDIHIHIPEGAVPKDGPSAGITMATAIISALNHKKIRPDIAMTGEITIRGRVLAIGGLKEKLLAAKRAQINTIIIPSQNQKDIEQMSSEVLENIEIIYVAHMDDVLKYVFVDDVDNNKENIK